MKMAISIALALAVTASVPAYAQSGFGQPPNSGGFGSGMQPAPNAGGFGGGTMAPNAGAGNFGTSPGGAAAPNPNVSPNFSAQQPAQDPMVQQQLQQLRQMAPIELQDFGIQPTQQLHSGAMHGPTPNSIPGARVITTAELFELVTTGTPYLLFDILGGDHVLPGAIMAVNAAQPGDFQDQTQQGFAQFLQQVTGGQQDAAMIFYCASTQCWMSYNAALRAANLGYRNVMWYRGGLEAWSYAGLPTMPAGGGMMPNAGGGAMAPGAGGMVTPNAGGGGMMPATGN